MEKYKLIKEKILSEADTLPTDAILPSRNQLTKKYNVGEMTVRRAFNELIAEGYVYAIKGKGYFVANKNLKIKEVVIVTHGTHLNDLININLEMITYSELYSNRAGYQTNMFFHNSNSTFENNILQKLANNNPYGTLYHASKNVDMAETYKIFFPKIKNLVVLDALPLSAKAKLVTSDNYNIQLKMCKALNKQEYDKIYYIDLDNWQATNIHTERLKAFKDVFGKKNPYIYLSNDMVFNALDSLCKYLNKDLRNYKRVCMIFLGCYQLDWVYRNIKDVLDTLEYVGVGCFEKPPCEMAENAHIIWVKQDVQSICKEAVSILKEGVKDTQRVEIPASLEFIN